MSYYSFEPAGAWSSLGAAVLHFLWQGALIGCVSAGILICIRRTASSARYAVALGGLLVGFLVFSSTFLHFLLNSSGPMLPLSGALPLLNLGEGFVAAPASSLDGALIAAWCWLVGTILMSIRMLRNCLGVRHLKTTLISAPEVSWVREFHELRLKIGVQRVVRLVASGVAEVPMVVGWLSPIVIVPVAAFASLDPAQLRCLLAHELQHIRRHDPVINAIQVVLETILFFHPAVWWLSKQMRIEREYCCDQAAVQLAGDPKLLAQALASMEALRIQLPNPDFVLAANGGPLMQRITRILGLRPNRRSFFSGWQLPIGLIVTGIMATAGQTLAQPSVMLADEVVAQETGQDATPRKKVRPAKKAETPTDQRKVRERYAASETKLRKLVESGLATEAEVEQRLAQMRKDIKARKVSNGAEKSASDNKQGKEMRAKYDAMKARIDAAVKSGKITKEAGQERLTEFRKGLGEERAAAKFAAKPDAEQRRRGYTERYDAAKKKLDGSVKDGAITADQAKLRLEGLRKSFGEAERKLKAADGK
ncbi:MAG: beta-lactamase regulating signal transducer with metallopeptidase domain, partial [Planctomycetota bacterium]